MFNIDYKGGNTVVINAKKSTLVADPKSSMVGIKDVVLKDAVELATEARFALNSSDAKLCIEGPGEYEVGEFSIKGVAAQRHIDNDSDGLLATIYRIRVGDVNIALLGNVAGKLNDYQLEELSVIDVLILPVGGGGYTLDATSAVGIVRQIDPKIVIPVHYADNVLEYEVPQDTLETFTGELGAPVETVNKYKLKSSASLPSVITVIEITRT